MDTAQLLLKAGEGVFARRGFDGATVKEIADEAGVNVSLVSYHFNGKEGLYKACLERFGRDRLAAAERVLKTPESIEDFRVRLQLFVEEFIECHVEQPAVTSIIHRACASEHTITKELFRNVFLKVFETLVAFVRSAQKAGIVRADLDAPTSTGLFFGGLVHHIRMDEMRREVYGKSIADPKYRELVVTTAIRGFIEGVLK